MPIPTPGPDEGEQDFISRCIGAVTHADPERDPKQTQAICYAQWRRKEQMHPDFTRILATFIKQYGEEGQAKFNNFVALNSLKTDREYKPQAQFTESFQWVEPLISKYREDAEAKYYKVIALTANVSMNNNDYSDYEKLKAATPSLTYRPVNINHDEAKWLPFPRTRVDFTQADEMSVEATLRVDNQDKWLQDKLPPNKGIAQVSIEGRPAPEGMNTGFHFTGLALLETGVHLPGDPLTEIQPLFLNESVGSEMCKLINGQVVCKRETNLKESEKTKMSTKEAELKATGKCVCPMCGQIDEQSEKECALQKCSRDSCGHQMQIQTDRASKKEAEAATPEYKPEEMVAKLLKESAAQKAENVKLQEQFTVVEAEKRKLSEEALHQAARISDLEFDLNQRAAKLRSIEESLAQTQKDFSRVDTERKFAFRERDEAQVKLAAEAQARMNALKEQSNLQVECADANERVSRTVSENLDLSKRLAEYSRKINEKDKAIESKDKALAEKDAEITKTNEKVTKALRFQSWAWRELKRAGVAVVESAEP